MRCRWKHDENENRQQLDRGRRKQHAPFDALGDPIISDMTRGAVFARFVVKMKAKRNSFQAYTMTKIATATMPCADSGRITLARTCRLRGAVHHGGLVEFPRDLIDERPHHHRAERHEERGVEDDQDRVGVAQRAH